MCNCRHEISENIKKAMNLDNGTIDFELISSKTYSDFGYTDAKSKRKTVPIFHSHCPWCGEPYPVVTLEKTKEATWTNT